MKDKKKKIVKFIIKAGMVIAVVSAVAIFSIAQAGRTPNHNQRLVRG